MAALPPTRAPVLPGNDPGYLSSNFTVQAGQIAAASICATLAIGLVWAMFYVYWYMPWHEKPVHDCCGRPFDNSCSHECVYKCKEDCYRCPEDCEKCCPGCMGGTEPLSVRARHPEWNKAHMAMPPCGEPATKQPSLQLTERPFSWGVPPMAPAPSSDFVPPPKLMGVSPLSPGAAVYGGPTIGGPTMGGPTIGGPTIGGPSLAPLAAAPPPKSATASPKAAPKKQKASK